MPRILVVDEDEDVRELLEVALDLQGREIDSVASEQAALERLAQHAYDLVVCDLSVADLDGHAVYRAIEGQPPPRPAVVFVTGTEAGSHTDWLGTADVPVVSKPFDINVLREAVRRALGKA